MTNINRESNEKPRTSTLLRMLLSSSLIAGLTGVFFSLFGLLYRAGHLSSFGIDAAAFLPSSPTELSYWGYLAIVEAWSSFNDLIGRATFWYSVLGGATVGLVIVNTYLAIEGRKAAAKTRLWRRRLRSSRLAQGSILSAFALAFVLLSPWLAVVVTATVIALPLHGYDGGKRAGEQAIADYRKALDGDSSRCHFLTGLREPVGTCLLVIAQTKERIAFADREQVKIVPAEGVEISWTPSSLRSRESDR